MVSFLALAIVLMIVAVAAVAFPLLRAGTDTSPVAAVSTAVLIPAAAILLYASVTTYSWFSAPGGAPTAGATGTEQGAGAAAGPDLAALRAATNQAPNDPQAWLALGSGFVEAERFADAKDAYKRAESLGAAGTDARLGLAEAEILENPATLDGAAGAAVEAILAEEPGNQKALWYGGMVASRRGDNGTARSRWQALLATPLPQAIRHVLEQRLASLQEPGGVPGIGRRGDTEVTAQASQPASKTTPAAGSSDVAGLTLDIRVDNALKSRVPAGAALFVFARDPDRPGPPVAVVRRSAGELPLTLSLTDANMMVPGQSLSALPRVKLTARVSMRGDPIAGPGDIYGEILWARGQPGAPIRIVLNSVFGQP